MKNLLSVSTIVFFLSSTAFASDFEQELEGLATGQITEIAQSSEVVDAIKAQNVITAAYDQTKIDALDRKWRSEADSVEQPMIDNVLENDLSTYLANIQENSSDLYLEIFVMDAKGLNVGQSSVTSDYWQGDEAKWQKTYLKGPGAVHISELEEDESTQQLQSQVSVSVSDPATGKVIGAVTFGVNVSNL